MRYFPLIVGIFLTLFLSQCHFAKGEECLDVPDPTNPRQRVNVPCPVVEYPKVGKRQTASGFRIDLACQGVSAEVCTQAYKTFERAGQIISGYIKLNTLVTVNATFAPFCTVYGICSTQGGTLGAAGPSRYISLVSGDGMSRYYPQSLVKQLNLAQGPQFSSYDIVARFNSEFSWAFEGPSTIAADQYDFLTIVLHEFTHGLGFTTWWDDYFNAAPSMLTPMALYQETTAGVKFMGFAESAFDGLLVQRSNLARISLLTAELSKIGGGPGAMFPSLSALETAITSSAEYGVIGKLMHQLGTTPQALGLLPDGKNTADDVFVVETSLVPFKGTSSIAHCDFTLYSNTAETLMTWKAPPGRTFQAAGGGLGPRLLSIMASMGYTLA